MIVSWDKAGRKASKPGEEYKSELQFKKKKKTHYHFEHVISISESFYTNLLPSYAKFFQGMFSALLQPLTTAGGMKSPRGKARTTLEMLLLHSDLFTISKQISYYLFDTYDWCSSQREGGNKWREKIDSFYQASKRAQDNENLAVRGKTHWVSTECC